MTQPTRTVDLRSDTVTRPDAGMRRAIADAEVGDDVLDKDPSVGALEERVASILGKEAALFVPSGTMANQISIRYHCPPGSEVILDRRSHVANYEAGAAQALGGVGFWPLDGDRGLLDPGAVRDAIRPRIPHLPPTALVLVENTHNLAGGTVWPLEQLDAVAAVAREAGVPVHMDGARIWNASAASGESPARIAAGADTVSVAMSKGLGAPVGALVAGSRDFTEKCWVLRRQHGGGMRQSGILAAACVWALDHNLPGIVEDHANARFLAERLHGLPGVRVDLDATPTNIVFFDVGASGRTAFDVARSCEDAGVRLIPFDPTHLRAVTHRDVDRSDVEYAVDVLAATLRGDPGGAPAGQAGRGASGRTTPRASERKAGGR